MAGLDATVAADIRGITAEVEKLDRAQERAQRSARGVGDEIRKMGGYSRQDIEAMGGHVDGLVGKLAGYAAGVLSVRAAWQLAHGIVQQHYETLAKISAEFKSMVERAQGLATGGGSAQSASAMRSYILRTAELGGAGIEELFGFAEGFKGVHKGSSLTMQRDALLYAQQAHMAGVRDLGQFGQFMGTLTGGGLELGQAADWSLQIQQMAGTDAPAVLKKLRYAVSRLGPESLPQIAALLLAGAEGCKAGMVEKEDIEHVMQGGGVQELLDVQLSEDPALRAAYGRILPELRRTSGHLGRETQAALTDPTWRRRLEIERMKNIAAGARAGGTSAAEESEYETAKQDVLLHGKPPVYGTGWLQTLWTRSTTGREELETAAGNVGQDLLDQMKKLVSTTERLPRGTE